MSLNNWKELQRRDALTCGLVTNCDRCAKPNSPDGLLPTDALSHLGFDDLIESINWKKLPSGWYPESKAGYTHLPRILQKNVIDKSKTIRLPFNSIFYISIGDYAFFRRGNFFQYINYSVTGARFDFLAKETLVYKVPQYMIDWFDQAENYLKIFKKNSPLKYPFVSWHPKQRDSKKARFDDGLIITKNIYVEEFFFDK